jgi:hypothetical protein
MPGKWFRKPRIDHLRKSEYRLTYIGSYSRKGRLIFESGTWQAMIKRLCFLYKRKAVGGFEEHVRH